MTPFPLSKEDVGPVVSCLTVFFLLQLPVLIVRGWP